MIDGLIIYYTRRLVLFVWMLWAIFYFIVSGLISPNKTSPAEAFSHPRGRLILVFISCAGLGNFGYLFVRALAGAHDPDSVVALVLMCAGLLLFFTGICGMTYVRFRYLKNHWKLYIHVEEDLSLITMGPYRIVRHPIYALSLLIYLGMALVFQDLIAIFTNGLVVGGYVALAVYEDVMLTRGTRNYSEYKTKTRAMLVPWIF